MVAPSLHAILFALEMFVTGVVASFLGSIVGLGGAFIAIPVLRLFFHLPPAFVSGTSLFFVTANVGSASIAFWRQGRIERGLGFTMGLLAIPGSILGAIAVANFPAKGFDVAYSVILVVFGVDLLRRGSVKAAAGGGLSRLPWSAERTFFDRVSGETHVYRTSIPFIALAGLVTGFVSSFFGIGGGVIVVPLLLRGFALPAHIVSATSHFVILLSAPFGVTVHILDHTIAWAYAIPLAIGGLIGAQFGAGTAKRISTPVLVRTLAVLILVAAASLIVQHLI